ncbi:MAG: hypothetical protein HYX71_12050 [Opitutae bacterium]|nr:hypothetical protein [Opitutae bacterium]
MTTQDYLILASGFMTLLVTIHLLYGAFVLSGKKLEPLSAAVSLTARGRIVILLCVLNSLIGLFLAWRVILLN